MAKHHCIDRVEYKKKLEGAVKTRIKKYLLLSELHGKFKQITMMHFQIWSGYLEQTDLQFTITAEVLQLTGTSIALG